MIENLCQIELSVEELSFRVLYSLHAIISESTPPNAILDSADRWITKRGGVPCQCEGSDKVA